MKKHICECSGCNKTATVKLRNGHRICEDCAKILRRHSWKKDGCTGKRVRGFFKEVLIGHLGGDFNIYADVFVKL